MLWLRRNSLQNKGGTKAPLMSASGQKQTSAHVRVMSALPPKADINLCVNGTAATSFRAPAFFAASADINLCVNGTAATSFRAPAFFAASAFPQAVVRVPRQRREQIADNPARAGPDFDGNGHTG